MDKKRKVLESTYQYLWIREDGSKITDPWEVIDDQRRHICDKGEKKKSEKEFVIYDSKYNPKLSKVCKRCKYYHRYENERRKRGEFKKEWYWNGDLIRRYR